MPESVGPRKFPKKNEKDHMPKNTDKISFSIIFYNHFTISLQTNHGRY